jgi:hypothetical protein
MQIDARIYKPFDFNLLLGTLSTLGLGARRDSI